MCLCYSVTSDVQAISATAVGESTIDIQCWFIHGSDALGCKIVLVSDYPSVNNEQTMLLRSNTSASGRFNLTHKVSCYHRVFAFDIDVNNTLSNLTIEENLNSTMADTLCSGNQHRLVQLYVISFYSLVCVLCFCFIIFSLHF